MQYGMAAGIDAVNDSNLLESDYDSEWVYQLALALVAYIILKTQEIHS